MRKIFYLLSLLLLLSAVACTQKKENAEGTKKQTTNVKHPEWSRSAVMYEVNLRQYTQEGTIKAFQQHLSQLKELGVDVLWFMPIHPISKLNRKGELGSYYAVQDYLAVNPEYGTTDDFKALVKEAHNMGFKVMLDWVANHTGCDNVWIKDHPDWYVKDSIGNFVGPYDWTDTYKLNYENKEMRAAMIEALKYWVKECDIDGYRCDVAFEVPTDFWNDARKELDAIKPIFMLAEAEHPDLTQNAFDMVYNWPLKDLMALIAKGGEAEKPEYVHNSGVVISGGVKTAADLDALFAVQDSVFPGDVYQLNHITNHDLNSWEGTEFDRLGDGVRAFAVLTYTINGMPLIYTGQEVGYNHAFEFFKKDPIPSWDKNDTFEFYQKLNRLKHSQTALKAGTEGAPMLRYKTESPNAYIFERSAGDSRVVVFLNLSASLIDIKYTDKIPEGNLTDYFTGEKIAFPTQLKAWEYKVFVK